MGNVSSSLGTGAFDVSQFAGNPRANQRFHRRMLRYFPTASRILDLGCGRGDFLEVARRAGKDAFGVDRSEQAIRMCQDRGFEVMQSDLFAFLETEWKRFGEFQGIYCAHVLEHLDPDGALRLVRLAFNALSPNSKIVIVTPNPEDIDVMGRTFWLDMSHIRPYPAELLVAMCKWAGFQGVRQVKLHGLGIDRHLVRSFVVEKIRHGRRAFKPNLVVAATK